MKFERITTDSTLDNVLLKASFTENGKACRYNAILFADNAANTYRLVTSKGYSPMDNSECLEGKSILDNAFAGKEYITWSHRPENVALMIPLEAADMSCPGATELGVNFVVAGRIRN